MRYYFYIKVLPEKANYTLVLGRCVYILHGFKKKRNLSNIGVSFPEWSEASIGSSIAFVGESHVILEELRVQRYFAEMEEAGVFEVSQVVEVPEGLPEVSFTRDQTVQKIFPNKIRSRMKRLQERAESRGEVFNPKPLDKARELPFFHRLKLVSKSEETEFILHVVKQAIDSKASRFSSYGLANRTNLLGSVPDFKYLNQK